jgi:enoyl-CoA hydratase/carnithine racemase
MNDRVRVTVEGAIAHVVLNRPDKHNGVDFEMLRAVLAAQERLRGARDVRAVIVRGEGASFCAGLDFKSVLARPVEAAAMTAQLWSPRMNQFQAWSMGWRRLGVPVIAVIHGNCFGAGIQLALGADLRIATPSAQLSIMESKWGLVPDMGGPTLLRELVPIDVAKELAMTGRILSGTAAKALGLVTHVSEDPLAHALGIAAEIETRSPRPSISFTTPGGRAPTAPWPPSGSGSGAWWARRTSASRASATRRVPRRRTRPPTRPAASRKRPAGARFRESSAEIVD